MKKYTYLFVIAMVTMIMAPVFAQDFVDLDENHWAYEAVLQLQAAGIIEGYPDNTFGGKRTLTRYEFASALARILPLIDVSGLPTMEDFEALKAQVDGIVVEDPDLSAYAKTEALEKFITKAETGKFALKSDMDKFVTKADLDRISRMVNEFQEELKNLGVDVATAKRDIAALDTRIAELAAEVARVKFNGAANMFAIAAKNNDTHTHSVNDNCIETGANLLNSIYVVHDFDLTIRGRVNDTTTAVATINYGNYLDYLNEAGDEGYYENPNSPIDQFTPYYMYATTKLGENEVTAGRFPVQFTPYTLKKYDIDSYTSNVKTDDGNYPVDGIKFASSFYGVDLTMFAAKTNDNPWTSTDIYWNSTVELNDFDQLAGARATFNAPFGGNMGLTYVNAWEQGSNYDRLAIYGADYSALIAGKYNLVGSWTKSKWLLSDGGSVSSGINEDSVAWDAKVATGFGKLGFAAGYKTIGDNFDSLGNWDKIGNWDNPTGYRGAYADLAYPISSKIKLGITSEYLKDTEDPEYKVFQGIADLKYGLSSKCSLLANYRYVKWIDDSSDDEIESYLTLGVLRDLGTNANLKVSYQFINNDWGGGDTERAGLGVVQLGVVF